MYSLTELMGLNCFVLRNHLRHPRPTPQTCLRDKFLFSSTILFCVFVLTVHRPINKTCLINVRDT